MCVSGAASLIHARTAIEEQLEQFVHHPGVCRMSTRCSQTQSRAIATVDITCSIDLRSRIEQDLRDLHDVLRGLLSKSLDAVRRDIVQQRGPVLSCRACVHEL